MIGLNKRAGFGRTQAPWHWKKTLHMKRVAIVRSVTSKLADTGLVGSGFGRRDLQQFEVAIMGDLHLAPEQMHLFHEARDHFLASMTTGKSPGSQPGEGARVVQLGDLGHGKHGSGGRACFEFARAFLDSFHLPYTLVLGNHDLEGEEFSTDVDNLEAWAQVFGQPHYWAADLGPVLAIGLSTVRYRSNEYSHHEVYIDDEQIAWFERQLQASGGRPVVVFSHAPPQGCGLKVLKEVHVKNRCAWLNHSDRPERFLQIAARHPNLRLWFSGHFHTSHNYSDSISIVGPTAFVQVGVIGECNRDGFRHSRLLKGDAQGFQLFTVDHSGGGALRLDLTGTWAGAEAMRVFTPQGDQVTSRSRGGSVAGGAAGAERTRPPPGVDAWMMSRADCDLPAPSTPGQGKAASSAISSQWFPIGPRSILELQGQLLVEYDLASAAPVGLVCKVPPGCEVRLLDEAGNVVSSSGRQARPGAGAGAGGGVAEAAGSSRDSSNGNGRRSGSDGSEVAVVEVEDRMTGGLSRYPRNQWGGFFQIYQPNKWKLKVAKALAEREARLAGQGAQAAGQAGGAGAPAAVQQETVSVPA